MLLFHGFPRLETSPAFQGYEVLLSGVFASMVKRLFRGETRYSSRGEKPFGNEICSDGEAKLLCSCFPERKEKTFALISP